MLGGGQQSSQGVIHQPRSQAGLLARAFAAGRPWTWTSRTRVSRHSQRPRRLRITLHAVPSVLYKCMLRWTLCLQVCAGGRRRAGAGLRCAGGRAGCPGATQWQSCDTMAEYCRVATQLQSCDTISEFWITGLTVSGCFAAGQRPGEIRGFRDARRCLLHPPSQVRPGSVTHCLPCNHPPCCSLHSLRHGWASSQGALRMPGCSGCGWSLCCGWSPISAAAVAGG